MQQIPDVPMTSAEVVVNVVMLAVLVASVFGVIYLIAWMGFLPGRVADERSHPRAAAIKVASWAGLLLMGPLWLVALIWAYAGPGGEGVAERPAIESAPEES